MTTTPIPAAAWPRLTPGTGLTIVKLAPDGREAARYPGEIIDPPAPAGWISARAVWTHRAMNLDGLPMLPGDRIDEYFSATAWFNAFQVLAPSGVPRGWYVNVTYPATIVAEAMGPTLVWQDLYVDVIVLPGGAVTVRDEEELAASGLRQHEPSLHHRILESRDLILSNIRLHRFPFDQRGD
ncbi:MAG: DUF402 domain-containing protein [Chloroflexota bacterium]|nr:DUF402 domain-containing protein [Chloroflexota bacterium]